MSLVFGYIYIRLNDWYLFKNICKLGKTENIPNRNHHYMTGEPDSGYFYKVFKVKIDEMDEIETLLKNHFNNYNYKNIYNKGGLEFFNNTIIELIPSVLNSHNYYYELLSQEKIDQLTRNDENRNDENRNEINVIKPYPYQENIIENAFKYFQNNCKCILVLTCGAGKTLISLWISQKLNSDTIIIGVPSAKLLEQWNEVVKYFYPNKKILLVNKNVNLEQIENFLFFNRNDCIVITTYASSFKVKAACINIKIFRNIDFVFSFGINDEVHHLTSQNYNKQNKTRKFSNMIDIPCMKRISLTATLKLIECKEDENNNILSNDNVNIFGEIIFRLNLYDAIKQDIVCDYQIQNIIANEDQLQEQLIKYNIEDVRDQRLFLSSYISLKSIDENNTHHLLIYANNKNNTDIIFNYIDRLINEGYFNIDDLYYNIYNSDITKQEKETRLKNFENAKYGILIVVYSLGEGWDFPLLDGVVFSEKMASDIRIVQSALRPLRKNICKIRGKIILPILNDIDWTNTNKNDNTNDNEDLQKIKSVIYDMGQEDKDIIHKIKLCKISINQPNDKNNDTKNNEIVIKEFEEFNERLTLELKIKITRREALELTYERACKILKEYNLKSRKEYYELCKSDTRLPENPSDNFKSKFKTWIEYLNIDEKYYDLQECKNKINQYMDKDTDLINYNRKLSKLCEKLCEIDIRFPSEDIWVDYYKVKNLEDIFKDLTKKKKKRNIL